MSSSSLTGNSNLPAILGLPLELREEICYFALQDTILPEPLPPFDENFPKQLRATKERFLTLISLRLVCRQIQVEVDQVFQRDILPHTALNHFFHLLPGHELPQLWALRRKVLALPHLLRRARFYLRSPDKETICANDDADMIWDTLIQSQEGCERIPYEEDAQVIAEWTLDSSSAPEDVTIESHAPEVCGCQADRRYGKACAYATVIYQPLANSLRLKSFVWPNYRFEGDVIDDFVVCSTLEGRLEDLDLAAFDDLAKKKYKEVAVECLPPAFWEIYGDADSDRKTALRNELIEVGAEWVVESQKERSGIISSS